jgi:hypothetical protein
MIYHYLKQDALRLFPLSEIEGSLVVEHIFVVATEIIAKEAMLRFFKEDLDAAKSEVQTMATTYGDSMKLDFGVTPAAYSDPFISNKLKQDEMCVCIAIHVYDVQSYETIMRVMEYYTAGDDALVRADAYCH